MEFTEPGRKWGWAGGGNNSLRLQKTAFLISAAVCLLPFVSTAVALLTGVTFAVIFQHPFPRFNQKLVPALLQASVVGLGFGMNVNSAVNAGSQGLMLSIVSITGSLLFGFAIGKVLKIENKTSYLVSAGSAICGGSAIATISPVIRANENQTSVALGTVFILNSIALFLFPFIGHHLHLSQAQFGLWCAIAIHDTSSVVGAAAKYGSQALDIATTVKLARALWIIPVAFLSGFLFKNKRAKIRIPYFIGLFLAALVINTYLPAVQKVSGYIVDISKAGLTLTLFLIGSGLSAASLKSVGAKPLLQGVVLWVIISVATLMAIVYKYY